MKPLVAIMTALLCVLAVTAGGKDALVFDNTMHDYGDLLISHGAQSCRFEFVNVSDSVVCILGALTSCNCTTVDYPREAIEPGQGGAVVVTYDPVGRPEGEFERTVLLILNGESRRVVLRFKGNAIDDSASFLLQQQLPFPSWYLPAFRRCRH